VVGPAPGAYTPASRYTFLTAAGGLSGSFASLSTPADFSQAFAFLTPTLSYDAGGVVIGFAQTTGFAAAAATANQAATASALQALGLGNPLYDAVVGQSFGGARQAFDALSGEVHADVLTAAFEDSRLVREAVLDRLSRASAPLTGPGSAFTIAGIAGGGTDGLALTAGHDADLPGRQTFGPPPGAAAGLWARVLGDAGTSRGDGNAATLSRDSGGLILGGDLGGIAFAGGSLRLGAAAGALHDSLAVDGRGASGHLDQLFGAVYGGASFGAVELSAGTAYGSMSTGIDRRIAFPGFDEAASSESHGWTAQAFGEAGYRFDLSGRDLGPAALEAAFWQPILGAALIRLHQDDFGEAGGPAALTGLAGSQDLATTTLGVRAAATLAGPLPLEFRGLVGWRHAYGDIVPTAALAFQGGQPFSVAGVPVDRDALVAEAGLALPLGRQSSLGLSYSGQFGKTAADNAISATITVGF
jgi:outer membrane autotransporter protein